MFVEFYHGRNLPRFECGWVGEIYSIFAREGRFGTLIDMSIHTRRRRSFVSAIVTAMVLCAAASAFAFDIGSIVNNKPKEPDKFAVIRVDKLASLMNDPNSHVNIYDANGWGLRSTAGVVPGAHLLTSDDKYDVAKELPPAKNAKLVFYCADLH
jgi:hypothetical protein